MMDSSAGNKSHMNFQGWGNQNGWPTTSTQGLAINPHSNSQHLCASSDQQPLYSHPQASNQSCSNNLNALSSAPNAAPHMLASNLILHNTAVPSASHLMSFAQQVPPTPSMQAAANQRKATLRSSLLQPCSSQHFPPLPANNPYKTFQTQLLSQTFPAQDQPFSLPSCGLSVNMSQATFGGHDGESAGVGGSSNSYVSSTSKEHPQWVPSSHDSRAVSDSTSAVQVNKQPSQETDGEKRSSILNQRAQLLKQLENIDKLLELLPPDDSNDGQAPSRAFQTETGDAQQLQPPEEESMSDEPEEPLSPAEPEEMQNSCRESEDDIGSDYVRQSDGSVSDCQSEGASDSEDYLSDSSSKSPTNESPTTQKNKEESEDPLSEEKNASPPEETHKTNQKKLSKAMVEPKSNQKEGHFYKRNYCLFCSKPVTKMSRHLTNLHSDKAKVAIAFQYPANSRERKKVWEKLINEGNFAHNKDVLKTGNGQLAVRVRPRKPAKSIDFVPCVYCLGLYKKKSLIGHIKRCPEKGKTEDETKIKNKRIMSKCALLTKNCDDLSEEFKNILGGMIYDEVTEIIMEDRIIVQFGEHMLNEIGHNVKRHEYLRQNLRHVARLVLEAQKSTPMQSLEDFLDPSNFRHVVSAVKVIAGYDPEKKTYNLPSLAYKLGYNLKKICGIVQHNAINSGDAKVQKSCETFLSLHDKKWKRLISSRALTGMRKTRRKNEKIVPFAEDVKCLYHHMENVYQLAVKKLRENACAENYAALATVVLAQVIAFNRRKSGEVAGVPIKAFMLRKRSGVLDDMDVSVSNLERTLCGFFSRVDIRGSCGRMVPVLLKPSFESAMELLINVRETCGVPSDNPFVFARPFVLSAYRGSHCVQRYAKECGAKNPAALTSVKLRKHFTTMLQLIHLDENEARQIFGPDNQIQALLQNNMCENTDMGHEDSDSNHKTKHIWKESEILAVEKHLMQFINERKVPQKDDCIRCLEAEPRALKQRSWTGVKDYVRNRITTLQRQSGSSKDGEPRLKEPQQSSVGSQPSIDQAAAEHHSVVSTSGLEPGTPNRQRAPGATSHTKSAAPRANKAREKGLKPKPKPKWSEAEVHAVEKHLMRLIKEHRLPQKDDCVRCLEAEPHALRNRSWKGVKDYVRNRITTLQRRSGLSGNPPKPSKRPRQKEAPQSSVRFQPSNRQEVATEHQSVDSTSSFGSVHLNQQVNEVTTSYGKTASPKTVKLRGKAAAASHPKTKHKWDEAEVSAVEKHMMSFISEYRLPQKDDCVRCLTAEPHALRNRSWKGVKDYVRNRITTSQRQSGFSGNSTKASKRPRQEKAQQSSRYYQQL
ncbi:uncharacterized protein LOC108242808 [Kryptolebias marmoratus]|uniref:uncharacterized protein LOC108242808 n=1 Tax=Kryptolebias marmoratus TaxID=37003 RepID=UPI0007F8EAE6|nr:uncharacterized protein LOC108242808 [Kryptolebias marmoratus]XP_017283382.1 uncharacterized protein LOC108242808 [Kryptolebias marmoratus]